MSMGLMERRRPFIDPGVGGQDWLMLRNSFPSQQLRIAAELSQDTWRTIYKEFIIKLNAPRALWQRLRSPASPSYVRRPH
jgi:hypothetical protein